MTNVSVVGASGMRREISSKPFDTIRGDLKRKSTDNPLHAPSRDRTTSHHPLQPSARSGCGFYLFASRVDECAKVGDIDLLVFSRKVNLMAKLDILTQLNQQLGEQKIDIAIYPELSRPFARLAVKDGVAL
jgi:hypothetical protein